MLLAGLKLNCLGYEADTLSCAPQRLHIYPKQEAQTFTVSMDLLIKVHSTRVFLIIYQGPVTGYITIEERKPDLSTIVEEQFTTGEKICTYG